MEIKCLFRNTLCVNIDYSMLKIYLLILLIFVYIDSYLGTFRAKCYK